MIKADSRSFDAKTKLKKSNILNHSHSISRSKDSFITESEPTREKSNSRKMTLYRRVTYTLREGSSMGTVVTLVMTACVGPGVLSLPYAVAASGWLFAIIQMILCALLCYFSLLLMTKVGKITQKYTYSTIAESLFQGKKFAFFVKIVFFMNNWGAAVADLILVNDLITRCLINLNLDSMPDFLIDSQSNFWPIMLGTFVGFPLCLKKSYSELRAVLYLGFILTLYVITVIFKNCIQAGFRQDVTAAIMFRPQGIFTTLPITFFSFACHPVVLDGFKELEVQNEKKYRKVLMKTMTTLLVFYACIGIFGYLTFSLYEYKLSAGNILLAYRPGDIPVDLAILFFALTMTFSLPLGIKPVKAVLVEILTPGARTESINRHVVLTAITVGSVILCSVLISNMTLVVGFLGASFNAMIVFNLPCIYYIKLVNSKKKKKKLRYYCAHLLNGSMLIFSIFSIALLIYQTIMGVAPVGGG